MEPPRRDERGSDAPDDLRDVAEVWEAHAQADPLWAVASDPSRAGRQWDLDAFLESGRYEVDRLLRRFTDLGGTLVDRALALDFGCGVGRLSQPLGDRFERVLGLDVSPTMVAVARRLNRHGDRVTFRCNDSERLDGVASGSVSFALSLITLQHVRPVLARGYLSELLRVLKPGGALVVQIPSHLDEDFLPSDRDDRPVEAADRRAELALEQPVGPLRSGVPTTVDVTVINRSRRTWVQSEPHALNVGAHWSAADGAPPASDGGRVRLPGRLGPGSATEVRLSVTPPGPGTYRLSVDVVQEGVAWFGGNAPRRGRRATGSDCVMVTVEPAPAARTEVSCADGGIGAFGDLVSPDPCAPPAFEMHPIPRHEVETIVAAAGAQLIGADDVVDGWHLVTYFIEVTA
jgi:SAM-dependent methyltransferase